MQQAGDRRSPSIRNAVLLFLIAALLMTYYTITHSGVFRIDDEHILASRAISLHLNGEFSDHQVYGNQRVRELYELGDAATEIEPGQALLAQPFLWMASFLDIGYVQVLFWMTALLTAGTAVVLAGSVLSWGFPAGTAVWTALLFALATSAAAYADTFYRDSQAMFFGMCAFYGMMVWFRRGKAAGLILFGAAAFAAVLTKNNMLALLPAFAVGQILSLERMKAMENWPRIRRVILIGTAVLLMAGTTVLLMPDRGTFSRFSRSYYLFLLEFFRDSLTPAFVLQALGPFISPAKSIFLFSPPLLLAVFGIREIWKRDRALTAAVLVFVVGITAAQALFFREEWAGTFGWGLRFMLPALPVCMLLGAGILEQWQSSNEWKRFLPAAFLSVGAVINIAGSVVSWRVPYRGWLQQGLDPYSAGTAWRLKFLAIPLQLGGLFDVSTWSLNWLRAAVAGFPAAYLVPVLGGALLAGLGVLVFRLLKKEGLGYSGAVTLGLLAGVVLMYPLYPGLWLSRVDSYWCAGDQAYSQALKYVEERAGGDDVVVFDSYGTDHWHCWLNDWRGEQPWYSLAYEISGPGSNDGTVALSRPTQMLFEDLEGDNNRIFYVATNQAPDYATGSERAWLENCCAGMGGEMFTGGDVEISVSIFDVPGE